MNKIAIEAAMQALRLFQRGQITPAMLAKAAEAVMRVAAKVMK